LDFSTGAVARVVPNPAKTAAVDRVRNDLLLSAFESRVIDSEVDDCCTFNDAGWNAETSVAASNKKERTVVLVNMVIIEYIIEYINYTKRSAAMYLINL